METKVAMVSEINIAAIELVTNLLIRTTLHKPFHISYSVKSKICVLFVLKNKNLIIITFRDKQEKNNLLILNHFLLSWLDE